MFEKFENIKARYVGFMMGVARGRVRRELLSRNDRLLNDIGVSRELLEQGVDAWPWKANGQANESVHESNERARGALNVTPAHSLLDGIRAMVGGTKGFSA